MILNCYLMIRQRFFCGSVLSKAYLTVAVVFFLWAGQCLAPVPCVGFSIGEERDIGEQLLFAVRSEFELLDDPDIVQYINKLGQQVLAIAGPQYFDYHFFVVKNDQFNAFAAPSGLIFFNSGLIKTMQSEDQLLSVLAHEVGHVVSRHLSRRIAKQEKVTAASLIFGLASLAVGNPALTQGLFSGALAANQTAGLNFSRQDEEQADRLAFGWLRIMGRNPTAMESMLKSMRRITRYRSEQLPPYLLTHPNPEDRLDYVQSLLEIERRKMGKPFPEDVGAFPFLRFKYRVLSQSVDPEDLRIHCANTLASTEDSVQTAMAHYGLALLSGQENNFKEAQRQLAMVRNEFPGRDILDIDLAALYIDSGELEMAVRLLRRMYQRDPTDMYCVFKLANVMSRKGKLEEAGAFYLEVAKNIPEYSQVYYELARVKSGQGERGASTFYLAKYYLYEGRIKYAKQYLRRAEKDPQVPGPLQEEAKVILKRLKELEDA
ncbi:MAG: M48 family metalloprotease [Candidatus Electrothrix sp. GW3-4]|uniref:beta-barrel assembly-enhancing protease n=1 Tax=Candidatus Electrothrix sp. GW3-4 TaxID=3126740 RepID=UPI0030CF3493